MVAMRLEIHRRHPLIGTEVRGIDLRAPLDDGAVDELRRIWMEHPLLVFPEQPITDAEQIAFARRFGDLEIHPSTSHRSSTHPEIYRVANVDEQGNRLPTDEDAWKYLELTWLWHSDSSFREVPSAGSILHGIEVPATGGDTLFCNLHAVWEALPAGRQRELEALRVVHSHDHILSLSRRGISNREGYTPLPPVAHPLVRMHPVTGRRSLFISPHTMERVVGWSEAASRALFEELTAFATAERFVHRHRWQPHDVIMWDNRCTMHAVTPYEADRVRRIMHRTTIVGDGPVQAALPGDGGTRRRA